MVDKGSPINTRGLTLQAPRALLSPGYLDPSFRDFALRELEGTVQFSTISELDISVCNRVNRGTEVSVMVGITPICKHRKHLRTISNWKKITVNFPQASRIQDSSLGWGAHC